MDADEVTVTVTISHKAYEKAGMLTNEKDGPAGELAGLMTADDYIERLVEIAHED